MCVCCCFLVIPHYIKSLWNEFITNEQRTHDVSRQIEILFVKSPRNHFPTENMKLSLEDSQEAYTHCCHFGWGGVHQYVHQYAFPIAFRSFIHFWFISCIVMIHTFLLKSLRLIGSLLRIPRRILFIPQVSWGFQEACRPHEAKCSCKQLRATSCKFTAMESKLR